MLVAGLNVLVDYNVVSAQPSRAVSFLDESLAVRSGGTDYHHALDALRPVSNAVEGNDAIQNDSLPNPSTSSKTPLGNGGKAVLESFLGGCAQVATLAVALLLLAPSLPWDRFGIWRPSCLV
jgi:hypothetical protein